MSWSWVPPLPNEEDDGPSPALRRTVTVLMVLITGVFALYYASVALGITNNDSCVENRPAGVGRADVDSHWRWWPPGRVCDYPPQETPIEAAVPTSLLRWHLSPS